MIAEIIDITLLASIVIIPLSLLGYFVYEAKKRPNKYTPEIRDFNNVSSKEKVASNSVVQGASISCVSDTSVSVSSTCDSGGC
jgi:hypothetical protein